MLPAGIVTLDTYLSNGGRCYQDVGPHTEYDTPEIASSLVDTVTSEIAGERIVHAILESVKAKKQIADYRLNKRLVDNQGTTCGHHENYSCGTDGITIDKEHLTLLGLHLATRNVWAGAGCLLPQNNRNVFYLSQKIGSLEYDYASSTTNQSKPLVNLRNQQLADKSRFVRVHVTSGDANMSPWAMWMSLGTTSIVLRLIENSIDIGDLATQLDVLSLAKAVNTDPNMTRLYDLTDERRVTAIDIQSMLVDLAYKHADEMMLPEEEARVLREWERVLFDLDIEPLSTIDRVEWIARRQLILGHCNKKHRSCNDERLLDLDKMWDEISPRGIALNKLRTGLWSAWMPDQAAIERAITTPPQNTRAAVRGRFVEKFAGRKGYGVTEWERLDMGNRCIMISDPRVSTTQEF
jgi:proteasome accessory factor A